MGFLSQIIPEGHACLAVYHNKRMRHYFFASAEEAERNLWRLAGQWDTYFAFASFVEAGKRRKSKVKAIKAFVFDVDTGKEGAYKNKDEALAAIDRHIEAGNLRKPTYIIDSGGGYHLYWLLTEPISREDWVARAKAFRDHLLKIDPVLAVDTVRVTDPAGLLRVPGTWNTKHDRITQIIRHDPEAIYTAEDFPAQSAVLPAAPVNAGTAADDLASTGRTRVPAKDLFDACPQFMDAFQNQASEKYPAWWLTVQLCAFTEEGEKLAHFMSHKYPGYSPEETSKKYAEAEESASEEGVGPATCEAYAEARGKEKCFGCPYYGKVKSPIVAALQRAQLRAEQAKQAALMEQLNPAAQANTVAEQESAEGVTAPPAPQVPNAKEAVARQGAISGLVFDFNPETGCVMAQIQSGQQVQSVLAAPRAMRVLGRVEGEEATAIIGMYDKRGTRITRIFHVPVSHLSTVQTLHKVYNAAGYAVPAGNEIAQRAFRMYASALTMEYNLVATVYRGAGRMGWTSDGFVLGDRIYTKDGDEKVEPTDELKKVLPLFETGGFKEWHYQAFNEMMDMLRPEAKVALMAAIASPLMHLTGQSGLFVHLYGPSGCGKSTLLRIAAGIYGKPLSTHFTPNDTRASREARLYLYRHLPALFDEITPLLADGESMQGFVYSITNGEGYHRATREGHLQRPKSGWNLIALTTANLSLWNTSTNTNKRPAGYVDEAVLLRVMELRVTGEKMFADDDVRAQNALAVLMENYGWIGRDFIAYIAKHRQQLQERLRSLVDESNRIYTQRYRFINAGLACIQVASEIFAELGLKGVDMSLLNEISRKLRGEAEQRREDIKEAQSPKALFGRFVKFIRDGTAVFVKTTNDVGAGSNLDGFSLQSRPRQSPVARLLVEPGGIRLIVSVSAVQSFAEAIHVSPHEIVDMFIQAGILPEGTKTSGMFAYDLQAGLPDQSGNIAPVALKEPCFLMTPPLEYQ